MGEGIGDGEVEWGVTGDLESMVERNRHYGVLEYVCMKPYQTQHCLLCL